MRSDMRSGVGATAAQQAQARSVRRRNNGIKLLIFLLLLLVAASTVYPLIFMVLNAFKQRVEYYTNIYGLPNAFYLGNFTLLAQNYNVARNFLNSVFVVGIALTASTFLAALASFPMAKLRFRGKRFFFGLIIGLLLIPGQVLLIPIYLLFSRLHLIDNYLSVILIYTVTTLPFSMFFLTSNFESIPNELLEAAKIDGASLLRTFLAIVLPMGRPAITTLALLNFLGLWNELILGLLLLPDETKRLLTPTIGMLAGRLVTNQPLLMAGLLVTSLPTILILVFFSRYLVKGIALGATK